MANINLTDLISILLGWSIIGILAFRIYKKKQEHTSIWKIIIILFVGLFSFSIFIPFRNTTVELAILPLGVWILYLILKRRGSWIKYRNYAWLGFLGNYILLVTFFLTFWIHPFIYDMNSLDTYIRDTEDLKVISVHPSGKKDVYLVDDFLEIVPDMEEKEFFSTVSYEEMYMNDPFERNERFPYILVNSKSKWGSGIHSVIYIEYDYKGLVVTSENGSIYFRSNKSLLREGEQHES